MNYKLILLIGVLLVGCTKPELKATVVLLENGKSHNAVVVSTDKGSKKLDKVRESVDLIDKNTPPTETRIMSKEELESRFGSVLSIPNPKAVCYILHFKKNKMEIDSFAQNLIQEIVKKTINKAPSMVDIIGHTDTVGSNKSNIEKSFKQARYVASIIKEEMLKILKRKKDISITTLGYGEEDLLIPTPDNQANEKNRNVEICIK